MGDVFFYRNIGESKILKAILYTQLQGSIRRDEKIFLMVIQNAVDNLTFIVLLNVFIIDSEIDNFAYVLVVVKVIWLQVERVSIIM